MLEPALRSKLDSLYDEAHELWARFDIEVRRTSFHPFVPADYDMVEEALLPYRGKGMRFLEWGSANGAITIMADLLGFEAYGIEIDARLVDVARQLATKYQSNAQFAAGSFLPAGYVYRSPSGDTRTGTIEHGPSGYLELGRSLEDFDLIFGYPWSGEDGVMIDLFKRYAAPHAIFLLNTGRGCNALTQQTA